MAFTQLLMENPHTGARKSAPVGLSWTVLIFGFLPPLFRGDIKWGVIILLFWLFSAGLTNIVFMFIYNKLYIKELMLEGYKLREMPEGMEARVRDTLNMTLPH
ncbi:hypothetical protein [Paraperlucidibaca baekdonensis]|nr:hypothetical protein [Paraperlucidibaca baekdonensis]